MDPSLVSSEDNLANQISYQSNANPFYQSVNLMTIRQYHANPLTSTHTSSIESQAWCLYAKVFCHTFHNFGELLLGSRVHLIILWPLSVQFDLENQLHFSFGYPLRRISRPCFSDSSLLCSSTRYYSFHLGFLHFACVLFIQTILMILQSGTSIGLRSILLPEFIHQRVQHHLLLSKWGSALQLSTNPYQSSVNPMSMHLAFPYLHREQDLYAGPTIGLDGGWFHCNPSRQSAQPFSILDNICQSTANPGPTYQCNANLLNNANANATQSYQSIINLPTNALIHSTSQIH